MHDLHQHVRSGSLVSVQQALEEGCDVDAFDMQGASALHYAARLNRLAIAKVLLTNGANSNAQHKLLPTTPLHAAMVFTGDREPMAALLLDYGANPNATDRCDRTPLHLLISYMRFSDCELLLDTARLLCGAGAKVDALDDSDDSPISLAQDLQDQSLDPDEYEELIELLNESV